MPRPPTDAVSTACGTGGGATWFGSNGPPSSSISRTTAESERSRSAAIADARALPLPCSRMFATASSRQSCTAKAVFLESRAASQVSMIQRVSLSSSLESLRMRMADLKVSLAQVVIRSARSSRDRRDGGAAIEHDRHELLNAGSLEHREHVLVRRQHHQLAALPGDGLCADHQ